MIKAHDLQAGDPEKSMVWFNSEIQGVWDLRKVMFPFKSEGRKIPIEVSVQMQSDNRSSLLLEEGLHFYSIQAFSWLDETHQEEEEQSALLSLPIQMFISSRNTLTHPE